VIQSLIVEDDFSVSVTRCIVHYKLQLEYFISIQEASVLSFAEHFNATQSKILILIR